MENQDIVLKFFLAVIVLLCTGSAISAIRHIWRYNIKETRALSEVLGKLRSMENNSPEEDSGGRTDPRPKQLVAVQDILEGLPGATIIADRLALIGKMRGLRVKVNIRTLQQMTLAREASLKGLSLPESAANTSMMLGLLGTIVGLTFMLHNMSGFQPANMGQIDIASWTKSIESVNKIMSSMKMGFGATMAGLVSAILLSALNFFLAASQSRFLSKLDRDTTEVILPATVPATEDESLLEQVSLQLERSFSELTHLAGENKDTMERVEALRNGFLEIVDVVKQSNRSDNTDRVVGLVAKLGEIMNQVSGVSHSVVRLSDEMPNILQQVQTASAGNLARIDKLINLYEQQRSLMNWPYHIKVVLGFMASLNVALIIYVLVR